MVVLITWLHFCIMLTFVQVLLILPLLKSLGLRVDLPVKTATAARVRLEPRPVVPQGLPMQGHP
jgi:hypothetical protein